MIYPLVYLWRYVRLLQNLPAECLVISAEARHALLREVQALPQERMLQISDPQMFSDDFILFEVKISTLERERR